LRRISRVREMTATPSNRERAGAKEPRKLLAVERGSRRFDRGRIDAKGMAKLAIQVIGIKQMLSIRVI
jgi:hypothetical protein